VCDFKLLEVPDWWSPKRDLSAEAEGRVSVEKERRTRTVMLHERRMEKRPDISYDLDGDGLVNQKDLFLGKHFDRDNDGRLDTTEKAEAIKAIKEGFESRFLWGLEQTGGLKEHIRVLQKRGKILPGEDFSPLMDTYPVHPLT
jgi:hypothetical protein